MSISDELVEAVEQHDAEGVARLLAAGADPGAANREGRTALDLAPPRSSIAAALAEAVRPG